MGGDSKTLLAGIAACNWQDSNQLIAEGFFAS